MALDQISSQPPPEPRPLAPLPAEQATEPLALSSNDLAMGVLCHVGGFCTSVIVPLVIYLTARQRSRFLRHHSLEALNYQISQAIYAVALTLLVGLVAALLAVTVGWRWAIGTAVVIWILIAIVFALLEIVLVVVASMGAYRGQYYRYPLCLRPVG